MTDEERYVVNPLMKWFRRQPADWELYKPRHGTSATGWDIEARRNKLDLLIEAKFIKQSFISSFNGLVTSPLVNRAQHFMKIKPQSWCYHVCWAIGTLPHRYMDQPLLDYFARNLHFWEHYRQDLRLKYIFLVKDGKVAKILFTSFIKTASEYSRRVDDLTSVKTRREHAAELMQKYKYL